MALLATVDGEGGSGVEGPAAGNGGQSIRSQVGRALKLRCGLEGFEFPS